MKNNVVFVNFLTGQRTENQFVDILTSGQLSDLDARVEFLSMCIDHCAVVKGDSTHLSAELSEIMAHLEASVYEVLRIQNERSQLELEGKRLKNLPLKLVA